MPFSVMATKKEHNRRFNNHLRTERMMTWLVCCAIHRLALSRFMNQWQEWYQQKDKDSLKKPIFQ